MFGFSLTHHVRRISDPGFVSTFGSHGLLIVVAILSAGCLYAVTTCSQDLAGVLMLLHTICELTLYVLRYIPHIHVSVDS